MKKSSMFENYPDVVEVDDLRKMLGGISRRLAYRLLAEQEIRCVKVGRAYKIPKVCVIEYLMGEDMCRINLSSIFIKVPRSCRDEVKTIYDRAAKEIGDVPIVVANDGDVSALAGAMSLGAGSIMGLAMGTSEAVGYVNAEGNLLGWFNELAFAPVDLNECAMRDEWSGDIGVGCKYFSQDAVIKLAPAAGIALSENLSPAEKLKEVQKLTEQEVPFACDIFRSIGVYLAHTLSLYAMIYDLRTLLVLGRVASGIGGNLIIEECQRVLEEEFPDLCRKLRVMLPDEKFRRVGQSMAAASLPEV